MTGKRGGALAAVLVGALAACPGTALAQQPRSDSSFLTLLHVGDTHSRLEPTEVRLRVDIDDSLKGVPVFAELGGFPRLMSALGTARSAAKNPLFLHSGDLFQGSLYFTRYRGAADTDFWNLMGLDAAALGNHEFDEGPGLLQASLLGPARFAVVSANVDFSAEPAIDVSRVHAFTILEAGGERVGIVGLTTDETPFISSPGPRIRFADPAASAQPAVDALSRAGVKRIVLLTHEGYEEDLRLAGRLSGVDVIVGGHSHTLLGDFARIGLASRGRYPAEAVGADGGRTLVAHAWEWGKVLGMLEVRFDGDGNVASWTGRPRAVVGRRLFRIYDVPDLEGKKKRIEVTRGGSGSVTVAEYAGAAYEPVANAAQAAAYRRVYEELLSRLAADPAVALVDEDPAGARKLASYAEGVSELRTRVIARAAEEMPRGRNRGPGPIVADAMAWRTGADIALYNTGGVRTGINEGPISVATVYELLPFGNTLVTMPLTGTEVVRTLEEAVDFQVSRYGADERAAYVYVSGIAFTIDLGRPKGERIRDVRVKGAGGAYAPIDATHRYSVVVNSFMAAGGDRYDTPNAAGGKYDTQFGDAEAFLDYISGKTLTNVRDERVKVVR